ncbi:hypothetical protein HPP92_002379 [Vanilla planifolia]|uniref:Uncharacterized protein n=1 Tax=Vanilla planifolia TaxID=51239 RepID=A0A835SEL2_VANPL|nr:hypothetical protein HPP92_002379 [Vanilla planifolia]
MKGLSPPLLILRTHVKLPSNATLSVVQTTLNSLTESIKQMNMGNRRARCEVSEQVMRYQRVLVRKVFKQSEGQASQEHELLLINPELRRPAVFSHQQPPAPDALVRTARGMAAELIVPSFPLLKAASDPFEASYITQP